MSSVGTKRSIETVNGDALFSDMSSGTRPGKIMQTLDKIKNGEYPVDFNQVDDQGNTFLLKAIQVANRLSSDKRKYFYDIAEKLIDLDTENVMTGKENNEQFTPLFLSSVYTDASVGLLNKLVGRGQACRPSFIHRDSNTTALMDACGFVNTDAVSKAIIELIKIMSPESIGLVSRSDDTALTITCRSYGFNNSSYVEAVAFALIETGNSNPGHINKYYFDATSDHYIRGGTALVFAVQQKLLNVAIKLIETPNTNVAYVMNLSHDELYYAGVSFIEITAFDLFLQPLFRYDEDIPLTPLEEELYVKFMKYYYDNKDTSDAVISTFFNRYITISCNIQVLKNILIQRFGRQIVDEYCASSDLRNITNTTARTIHAEVAQGPPVLVRPLLVDDTEPSRSVSVDEEVQILPAVADTSTREPRISSLQQRLNASEIPIGYARPASPSPDIHGNDVRNYTYEDREYVRLAGPKTNDGHGGRRRTRKKTKTRTRTKTKKGKRTKRKRARL